SLTIFCHLRAKSRNLSRSSTVGAETERAIHTCAMVRWTGWQSRRGLRGPARSPCLGSLPCEVQETVTALGRQEKWEDSPEGPGQGATAGIALLAGILTTCHPKLEVSALGKSRCRACREWQRYPQAEGEGSLALAFYQPTLRQPPPHP